MKKFEPNVDGKNRTQANKIAFKAHNKLYDDYKNIINASEDFPLFIRRQKLANYLARYELYKKTLNVKGSIIECGCHKGSGLLLLAKLSAIFEPFQIHKKIISFDSFEGFPSVNKKKDNTKYKSVKKSYHTKYSNLNLIKNSIKTYDMNRFNSHLEKIEIVKGDAVRTIPKYLKENKHTLVSLLYLDFDLYEPTKIALDNFLPRMAKGGLIVFDELNVKEWQGETIAYLEKFSKKKVQLKQINFQHTISYFKV